MVRVAVFGGPPFFPPAPRGVPIDHPSITPFHTRGLQHLLHALQAALALPMRRLDDVAERDTGHDPSASVEDADDAATPSDAYTVAMLCVRCMLDGLPLEAQPSAPVRGVCAL